MGMKVYMSMVVASGNIEQNIVKNCALLTYYGRIT